MAGTRIQDQKITLSDGTKVAGKSIRLCTPGLFMTIGGSAPTRTIGTAKVNGVEIPVKRTRGRSRWVQAGKGAYYSATYGECCCGELVDSGVDGI